MITLVYLVRRRPDLSPQAFREAARAAQARTAELARERLGAVRHRLGFEACAKRSHCMATARRLGGQPPDALIELSWPNLEAFDAKMGTPDALRALDEFIDAERTWVDFARSTAFVVEKQDAALHAPIKTQLSKAELSNEPI
ncbi:MAG: hypothetical protein AAGM38_01460 [Pseudomonadota bacterium]